MYTILVCDDERDIVSALEIYLTAEGYRVLKAYNGKEALAIAGREDVHLILMDIMMPVMDGLTAMAQLRQTSNVPVILMYTFSFPLFMFTYIPISFAALFMKVEWKPIRHGAAARLPANLMKN